MAGLTRTAIVGAALDLLDEVGIEGVTTRSLARVLGVKSPALYWHFKNMRELLDAMADAMLPVAEWPGPSTPGLSTEEWLARRAHAFRKALLSHRDGAAVHAGTTPSRSDAAELEMRVAALVDRGMSPDNALRTLMAIARYTVGWTYEEQSHSKRERRGIDGLGSATTPLLERAAAVRTGQDPDADFDFGLRALIAGAVPPATMDQSGTSRGRMARAGSGLEPPRGT